MPEKPLGPFIEKKTKVHYKKMPGIYPSDLPTKSDFAAQIKRPESDKDKLPPKDEQKLVIVGEYLDDLSKKTGDMDKLAIYGQLFFLTDFWLKNNLTDTRKEKVKALFLTTVDKLCQEFNCPVNVLPKKLEEHWGRQLGVHGWGVDKQLTSGGISPKVAVYLERKKAEGYRLTFINGLAYQQTWWLKAQPIQMVPADSSAVGWTMPKDKLNKGQKLFEKNWAGFALSMGRDFYMAKHRGGFYSSNFFHSSYLAGNAVMCTGSMLIENGVVKGISNDSGHYQPRIEHLLNVVEALRMYGVNLSAITVKAMGGSYDDKNLPSSAKVVGKTLEMKGDALLAYYGGAKGLKGRREDYVRKVSIGDFDHPLMPPNREPKAPSNPTSCWLEYWQTAEYMFVTITRRKLPLPRGILGFPHSRWIEGVLTKCDLAHAEVIDRMIEDRDVAPAKVKFKTSGDEWNRVYKAYLDTINKELKIVGQSKSYTDQLTRIKEELERLNKGISDSINELVNGVNA